MRRCHWPLPTPATLLLSSALLFTMPASAANWIMFLGTEPAKAPGYRPFGFAGKVDDVFGVKVWASF